MNAREKKKKIGFRNAVVTEMSPFSVLCAQSLSHVPLFAISWTVGCQAPQSMGFSKQEYCSGLPFPSPGDFPDPGIELGSPHFRQMRGGVQRAIQVGEKPLEGAIME